MDEMQKRLLDSYDKAMEYVKGSADFVAEQAPLVVQEVVNWGIAYYTIWTVLGLFLTTLFFYFGRRFVKCAIAKGWFDDSESGPPSCILTGVLYILSGVWFIVTINAVIGLVYVLVAPRLYILEQLAQLINSVRRN